jgi:pyruvate kinase
MYLKKTKIVATLGPSSWNEDVLAGMIDAGLNVARLNFSHGSLEEKSKQIELIRKLSKEKNTHIAILADLPGPKLRLGMIDGVVTIEKNQEVVLSTEEKKDVLPLQYDFSDSINVNDRVYLNDGLIALVVTRVSGKDIFCTALNNGWVSSKKGVNLPDTVISGAAFEKKDQESAEFALSVGLIL